MEGANNDHSSEDLKQAMKEKAAQIEASLSALRDEIGSLAPSARKLIQDHPVTSACVLFGAGVFLGALIGGRPRSDRGPAGNGILDAALSPVVDAIRERLDAGESSESAVHGAFRTHVAPQPQYSDGVATQLVRILAPVAVDYARKAMEGNTEAKED